ncbi:helix-turn-helix domain-containing protein [Paraburkholderia strydomiana]
MSQTISPVPVRAGRALLGWSQQDLAKQARVAASTVADFERGQRTPMANNSDAIRSALESAGVAFYGGGHSSICRTPRRHSYLQASRYAGSKHLILQTGRTGGMVKPQCRNCLVD